jgi:hypothetical protein
MGHPGLLVTSVEGSDHPYRGETVSVYFSAVVARV